MFNPDKSIETDPTHRDTFTEQPFRIDVFTNFRDAEYFFGKNGRFEEFVSEDFGGSNSDLI